MDDNGETKDDVRLPEGETGQKIDKLFRIDEKDTSMLLPSWIVRTFANCWLDVTVLTSMGEEVAMDAKEAPRGSN